MMDTLSPAERSARMALIHSKNTGPEHIVRKLAFSMGFRFRLHRNDLPGNPDLVFVHRNAVIFVHGCFWHGHDTNNCKRRTPKTNRGYWLPKLRKNRARDEQAIRFLRNHGWRVMVVWECQTKRPEILAARLEKFLSRPIKSKNQ